MAKATNPRPDGPPSPRRPDRVDLPPVALARSQSPNPGPALPPPPPDAPPGEAAEYPVTPPSPPGHDE